MYANAATKRNISANRLPRVCVSHYQQVHDVLGCAIEIRLYQLAYSAYAILYSARH